MAEKKSEETVTVDDVKYRVDDLTDAAKAQIVNIRFVDEQIQQINNELAVSDTARMGYLAALRKQLQKPE